MQKLKKGFTLIELLVVIAIIAILATVIIINVTGARAKAARARVSSDMSNAVKIATACATFGGSFTAQAANTLSGSICALTGTVPTGITDPAEQAAATGSWPANTGMTSTAHTVITAGDTTLPTISITAPNGAVLGCSLTGCSVTSGTW